MAAQLRRVHLFARTPATAWSVWKYNWIVQHKMRRAILRAAPHATGTLLDVGCGTKPFAPLFAGRIERYVGVDLDPARWEGLPSADVRARAERLPFPDAAFDTVLGVSMLTYFPEPLELLRELHRVLRPGGVAILEFTQMAPLYDPPHDYYRFTPFGAAHLLGRAGLAPVASFPVGGLWTRVGHTTIAGLKRLNRGPTRVLTEIPVRVLYVVLQLFFEGMDRVFFDPKEVLAHVVVARRRGGHPPRHDESGRSSD